MNNLVILQKTEDGKIYCRELSDKGVEFHNDGNKDESCWDNILQDELDEILSKQR